MVTLWICKFGLSWKSKDLQSGLLLWPSRGPRTPHRDKKRSQGAGYLAGCDKSNSATSFMRVKDHHPFGWPPPKIDDKKPWRKGWWNVVNNPLPRPYRVVTSGFRTSQGLFTPETTNIFQWSPRDILAWPKIALWSKPFKAKIRQKCGLGSYVLTRGMGWQVSCKESCWRRNFTPV